MANTWIDIMYCKWCWCNKVKFVSDLLSLKQKLIYTGNIRLMWSENRIENIKGWSIQLENRIKNIKGAEHFKWSVSEYFGTKRHLSLKNENIRYDNIIYSSSYWVDWNSPLHVLIWIRVKILHYSINAAAMLLCNSLMTLL